MIQIFLILFVTAFGQGIEPEPNCQEGTTLQNGLCVVSDVENCTDNPYDYGCGVADKPQDDNLVVIVAFTISLIFIITIIMWMKRKK